MMNNTLFVTGWNFLVVLFMTFLVTTAPSGFLCVVYGMIMAVAPFFFITLMSVSNHRHSCLFEKTINTHAGVGVIIFIICAVCDGTVGYGVIPHWLFPYWALISSGMTLPFVYGLYALKRWDTFRLWVQCSKETGETLSCLSRFFV